MHPIEAWLQEHGHTQTWLSEQLGVTPQAISDIVRGRRQPGLSLAVKIERLTDIPTRDLTLSA